MTTRGASKRCPGCGATCDLTAVVCPQCGADVSGMHSAVMGSGTVAREAEALGSTHGNAAADAGRRCTACGAANPGFALLCVTCGAALPDEPGRLMLEAGGVCYPCQSGDILGREGTVAREYFAAIETVSRQHARLQMRDGAWWVEVPSAVRNLTQLDGQELARGVPNRLQGRHCLRLSSRCEVRLIVGAAEGGAA